MRECDGGIVPAGITRRGWLSATAASLGVAASVRADEPKLSPDEAQARDDVLARAKEVGIGRLKLRVTKRFFALSDAPDAFTTQALDICENLSTDYLEYFQARKFAIHPPERRLTLVILSTPKEQLKFLGDDDPEGEAQPVFDPDANRLVFFDLRSGGARFRANRERGNTITLCHETSLLLFENTGLLHPDADVPDSIRDGFADFLENRPPTGRWAAGKPNAGKLARLSGQRTVPWISVERLLGDDKAFEDAATIRDAEAESWVLVDLLIRSPARLPGFLRYLEAINTRREPGHRLADARAHLGDLDKLDKEVQAMVGTWRTFYEKLLETQKPSR